MLIRLRDVSHVNEWRDAKTPSCVVAEMVNNLYLWKNAQFVARFTFCRPNRRENLVPHVVAPRTSRPRQESTPRSPTPCPTPEEGTGRERGSLARLDALREEAKLRLSINTRLDRGRARADYKIIY